MLVSAAPAPEPCESFRLREPRCHSPVPASTSLAFPRPELQFAILPRTNGSRPCSPGPMVHPTFCPGLTQCWLPRQYGRRAVRGRTSRRSILERTKETRAVKLSRPTHRRLRSTGRGRCFGLRCAGDWLTRRAIRTAVHPGQEASDAIASRIRLARVPSGVFSLAMAWVWSCLLAGQTESVREWLLTSRRWCRSRACRFRHPLALALRTIASDLSYGRTGESTMRAGIWDEVKMGDLTRPRVDLRPFTCSDHTEKLLARDACSPFLSQEGAHPNTRSMAQRPALASGGSSSSSNLACPSSLPRATERYAACHAPVPPIKC